MLVHPGVGWEALFHSGRTKLVLWEGGGYNEVAGIAEEQQQVQPRREW